MDLLLPLFKKFFLISFIAFLDDLLLPSVFLKVINMKLFDDIFTL